MNRAKWIIIAVTTVTIACIPLPRRVACIVLAHLYPSALRPLGSIGFIPGTRLTYSEYTYQQSRPLILRSARRYQVDPQLVTAVAYVESRFNHEAISKRGALGLMQLMPATAQDMGVRYPLDAEQNIEGGTRYLSQLLTRFKGDLSLTLAGYNAGPGAVARRQGIPAFPETQHYVHEVLRTYHRIRRGESFAEVP